MTTPTPREAVTPLQVENELRELHGRLEELRLALVDARNEEMAAKADYERAKVHAGADLMCPRVERGKVTVAERQQFIDAYVLTELLALEEAKNKRVITNEALRTAQKQVEIVQSVGASVRTSYNTGGGQR